MIHAISTLSFAGLIICFLLFFIISVHFLNTLYKIYPKEAKHLLGEKKIWGTNQKFGLLLLWDNKLKNLSKRNVHLEFLRKMSIRIFWIFLMLLIFLPLFDIFGIALLK